MGIMIGAVGARKLRSFICVKKQFGKRPRVHLRQDKDAVDEEPGNQEDVDVRPGCVRCGFRSRCSLRAVM